MLQVCMLQDPAPEISHDRLKMVRMGPRTVIALADGAGGMSGAPEAAEQVVDRLLEIFPPGSPPLTPHVCAETLQAVDQAVASNPRAGESTALLVVLDGDSLVGASVGDCEAWAFPHDAQPRELTSNQMRKPRIGTGRSNPIGFGPTRMDGLLIMMTDGVAHYVTPLELAAVVRTAESEQLPKALVDHVRLPSGALPDHATVLVARQG